MRSTYGLLSVLCAIAWLVAAAPPASAEAPLETVTTAVQHAPADLGGGANLRPQVEALVQLIGARRFDEAENSAKELRLKFEQAFDSGQKQYVFASTAERDEYLSATKEQFQWVDWGYAECLIMQAYLESEKHNFERAVSALEAARKVAPSSASLEAELGYALNVQRKSVEALVAYQGALDKSLKWSSQKAYESVARRGIGVTLIELNRLDEAEASLRESLKTEPNSPVAKNELEYIRQLRQQP